jgi:hypothetical protein
VFVLLEISRPDLAPLERVCAAHIKDNQSCLGATVVHLNYAFVPFLACGVPDLKGDGVVSGDYLHLLETEANCGVLLFVEVFGPSSDHTCLSDA